MREQGLRGCAAALVLVTLGCRGCAAALVLVTLGSWGCAGASHSRGENPAPAWVSRGAHSAGGKRYYVGSCSSAETAEDARRLAAQDAMRQMANEVGVTVSQESSFSQQERDGVYSYDVQMQVSARSHPLTVKGFAVEAEHVADAQRGGGVDAWALASVPEGALAAAVRSAQGRVALVVQCEARGLLDCPTQALDALTQALTEGGVEIIGMEGEWGKDSRTLVRTAATRGAAFLVEAVVEARFEGEMAGEFYAYGRGKARVFDTEDGQVVASPDTGDKKSGQYSKEAAVRAALKKAAAALGDALAERLAP